jgi:large subunit ribosomal protein L25
MQVLAVKARPADLPPFLEVDISNLGIGDSIRASDITLPAGVELDEDPDSPIVVAHAPRAEVIPEVAAVDESETPAGDAEPTSDAS